MTRKDIEELIQVKKARGREIQILSSVLNSVYNNFQNDFNLIRYKTNDDGSIVQDEKGNYVSEEIPENELDSDDKALRDAYNMAIEDLSKLIAKI